MSKLEHLQICNKSEVCPQMSNGELAKWAKTEFNLPKCPAMSTILNVLRQHDQLRHLSGDYLPRKEFRSPHLVKRGEWVAEFVVHCEQEQVPITGGVIVAYAKKISEELGVPANHQSLFAYTGWFRHFTKRLRFRRKNGHGESGFVDVEVAAEHMPKLRDELMKYHPQDVFNMDETAFFYIAISRSSICLNEAPALKQSKARLTVAVTANADDFEKLPLLFLGMTSCPRWLREKPPKVDCAGTSKGWMTVRVFQDWLLHLDDKMGEVGREILLLLDNAPVHIEPDANLRHVRVLKFLPNTTAAIQPMDQGVIAYVKQGIKGLKTEAAMYRLLDGDSESYKGRLVDAIHWLQSTWDSMPADAAKSCWKHAGLFVDRTSIDCILNSE